MLNASFIYGALAGVIVLLCVWGSLLVFARGIRERSWKLTFAGFFLCYLLCILVDVIVFRIRGTNR